MGALIMVNLNGGSACSILKCQLPIQTLSKKAVRNSLVMQKFPACGTNIAAYGSRYVACYFTDYWMRWNGLFRVRKKAIPVCPDALRPGAYDLSLFCERCLDHISHSFPAYNAAVRREVLSEKKNGWEKKLFVDLSKRSSTAGM